jgi:hypothetical protein
MAAFQSIQSAGRQPAAESVHAFGFRLPSSLGPVDHARQIVHARSDRNRIQPARGCRRGPNRMSVGHRIGADRFRESPRILFAALAMIASGLVAVTEARAAWQDDARALAESAPAYISSPNALTTDAAKAPAALRARRASVRATRHQTSAGLTASAFLGRAVPAVSPPLSSGIAFDSPDTPPLPDAPGGVGIRAPPTS